MPASSPGKSEAEVLQYIAEHSPATVAGVAEHFARTKGLARTTVLTVMERLRKKRYLTRRKSEGVYRYSLKPIRRKQLRTLVGDFIQRALGGSVEPFLAYLAQDAELNDDEINELRKVAREVEARRRTEQS